MGRLGDISLGATAMRYFNYRASKDTKRSEGEDMFFSDTL